MRTFKMDDHDSETAFIFYEYQGKYMYLWNIFDGYQGKYMYLWKV